MNPVVLLETPESKIVRISNGNYAVWFKYPTTGKFQHIRYTKLGSKAVEELVHEYFYWNFVTKGRYM